MERGWRTKVEVALPKRLLILSGARIPVRLVGFVLGFVRCAAERRFVWGKLDETFWVEANDRLEVFVEAVGLGGRSRQTLQFVARNRLLTPRALRPPPPPPFRRPSCPRVRPPFIAARVPRVNAPSPRVIIGELT